MRLSEILGNHVVDERGEALGVVADVDLQRDEGYWAVTGIRVAHGHVRSLFGYERQEAGGPAPVRWLVRRLHRGDRFVPWGDVRYIGEGTVRVRTQAPAP
jgi:sporulation protein YlmC with PRC-barrel domain